VVLLANFDKCFAPLATYFSSDEPLITASAIPFPNSSTPNINPTIKYNIQLNNKNNNKEGFEDNVVQPPELIGRNVVINPQKKTIAIRFEQEKIDDKHKYFIILSKYNYNLENVGNLDIKIAKTTEPTIPIETTTTTTTIESPPLTETITTTTESPPQYEAICNTEGICEYIFTNVEDKDEKGNLFWYRLGIGIIEPSKSGGDKLGNIMPFRFGSGNSQEYFRVDNTIKEQQALLNKLADLEKLKASESAKSTQDLIEDTQLDEKGEPVYDAEAYMKMLKPYIGNYPDEFTLNNQKLDEVSLSKYLDKSLALGELNINVDVADIMPTKPVA
jgi:hypothetical protein